MNLTEAPDPEGFAQLPFGNWTNESHIVNEFDNDSNVSDDYVTRSNLHSSSILIPQDVPLSAVVLLAVLLGLLILSTAVGNLFVLVAIVRERHLQTVGNYLVLSLAVADMMVACLVMPMGAQYEITNHEWLLGPELCEVWTSGDVLCCTASILHLVAIALDRYWAVTNVQYAREGRRKRIAIMIAIVWSAGFLVSIAPILGWKDEKFLQRIQEERRCLVSQDSGYQIFATCATFYVPLVAILILYWQIYQVARKRIRHKPGAIRPIALWVPAADGSTVNSTCPNDMGTRMNAMEFVMKTGVVVYLFNLPTKQKKKRDESKRERKAAQTLAIITGVFVICWSPFFATALLMALCPSCDPGPRLFSLFLWLGYANSALNPLIYTLFSPDFRKAFTKVLCSRYQSNE